MTRPIRMEKIYLMTKNKRRTFATLMKYYIYIFIAFSVLLASCKSEFEQIRTSNDPQLIYKKGLAFFADEEYVKAQTLFELSIPNYRGKEEAEELFYKYAYTYFHTGEYILAAHYFDSFANTFFNSDKREEARYMASFSNYKLSPNPKLDQTYTKKAIDGFQTFVNTYPRSERVAQANSLIDEMRKKLETKDFLQGELYYNIGQYQAAVQSLSNVLKDYPDTKDAEKIRFLMLKASYLLAEKSVYSKKATRYKETIKLYEAFVEKYKKRDYKRQAKEIYNNSKKELKNIEA